MVKIILKALYKIVISGVISFAILTLFCYFYYNIPAHSANNDGSTDYKWEANVFYSRGTEGFAWGKTNNDGFTNMFDYYDDMKIDILIMGSSHMEAYQVDMNQSTASKLNALLENDTVYHIGTSGHSFLTCSSNLRSALNKYQPTKYVVIETGSVSFSDEAIALAINEETPKIPPNDGGIFGLLQKNPYLRLLYRQIQNYAKQNYTKLQAEDTEEAEDVKTLAGTDTATSENLEGDLLHKMNASAEEYDVRIIIVYHPHINIDSDGAIDLVADQSAITRFKKSCDANGILFLDMSTRFMKEYETSYILPHGFFNSAVGSGHLNKYGHAMIAEELYNLILEDEQ